MPGERIPLGARLRARLEVEKAESSVKDEAQTTLPPPNESKPLQTTLPPPHFTPPTAASLLGIDFAKGLGGECFTCGGEAAPARSAKLALQEALLSNSNRQLDRRPRSDKHVLRGGMVRLSPRLPAFNFVDKLGECGDARCGCYRLYRPDIRKHFRDVVSQTTLGQLSRSKLQRLRYVTVGSGSLLTDFEILCALDSLGVAIDSIICVDTCYDAEATEKKEADAALSQLGAFFSPATSVHAFGSVARFVDACALEPHLYGHATTFVHCDAGGVSTDDAKSAAVGCLVEGGHMFSLVNLGMLVNGAREAEGQQTHGTEHSGVVSGESELSRMRGYWKAQLRDGYALNAWRRLAGRPHANLAKKDRAAQLLEELPARTLSEPQSLGESRKALAEEWLSQSLHDRAAKHALALFKVVFRGPQFKDGKELSEAQRDIVAVRQAPSRAAQIVATRKPGDQVLVQRSHSARTRLCFCALFLLWRVHCCVVQVLVAEIRDGWVRLADEDDDWGWQKAYATEAHAPQEAWILIDATSLGLGRILECELDCLSLRSMREKRWGK